MRETTVDDFRYEDLERLPPEELARITEWLTEKVDALSTRLKAEPKEDEVRIWSRDRRCICTPAGRRGCKTQLRPQDPAAAVVVCAGCGVPADALEIAVLHGGAHPGS